MIKYSKIQYASVFTWTYKDQIIMTIAIRMGPNSCDWEVISKGAWKLQSTVTHHESSVDRHCEFTICACVGWLYSHCVVMQRWLAFVYMYMWCITFSSFHPCKVHLKRISLAVTGNPQSIVNININIGEIANILFVGVTSQTQLTA